jgi:predicted acyl esterase
MLPAGRYGNGQERYITLRIPLGLNFSLFYKGFCDFQGSLSWPWESLHVEVLAWYDHWLKGRDTGVMDGDPIRYTVPGADGYRTTTTWPPLESKLTAFALRTDGTLSTDEGLSGARAYRYLPQDSGQPSHLSPSTIPATLLWETSPMTEPFDFAGNIKLQLDASITALDTGFIVAIHDVAESGASEDNGRLAARFTFDC